MTISPVACEHPDHIHLVLLPNRQNDISGHWLVKRPKRQRRDDISRLRFQDDVQALRLNNLGGPSAKAVCVNMNSSSLWKFSRWLVLFRLQELSVCSPDQREIRAFVVRTSILHCMEVGTH